MIEAADSSGEGTTKANPTQRSPGMVSEPTGVDDQGMSLVLFQEVGSCHDRRLDVVLPVPVQSPPTKKGYYLVLGCIIAR